MFLCSCDGGNLTLQVRRTKGSPIPHVAMFASKEIRLGDEITFSYGDASAEVDAASHEGNTDAGCTAAVTLQGQRRHCYCKSKQCCGFLPRC